MTADILFLQTSCFITLIALAIREILCLRLVLTVAQFGHLAHSYLHFDYNKGTWILIYILINIMQLFIIYRDRQAGMTPEQIRDLYNNIFSSMTNRELLNFWDHGKIRSNSYHAGILIR